MIAPLTANTLARLAHGLADDLVTEAALAHDGPLLVAPAMNARMWAHPATQANAELLRARGVELIGPEEGELAEGEHGAGRMAEPEAIHARCVQLLAGGGSLQGRRVVVSAGGTREPLDSVRFLGNRSSGRMGVALAAEARRRGAEVTLLAANLSVPAPAGVEVVETPTAADLEREALRRSSADVVLMAAAVADYRPVEAHGGKRPKSGEPWEVVLEPTADILRALGERRVNGQILVGFAAEHGEAGIERARGEAACEGRGPRRLQRRLAQRRGLRRTRQRGDSHRSGRRASVAQGPPRSGSQARSSTRSRACWGRMDAAGRPGLRAEGSGAEAIDRVVANLGLVMHAPEETLQLCVLCLVAEGHLIIEDFPGVGKTMLAKALARSVDCRFSRLQFTPDLLPTDVTGVNVFNQQRNEFEFRPGPVFANILLVDEINRASPKTQAALLECMQEDQVTVDGVTYPLERPFMALATQNPVEYEGTYPLPEAQLDRFTLRIAIGYPPLGDEARMLSEQTSDPPLDSLTPAVTAAEVLAAIEEAKAVFVEESLNRYVVAVLRYTRSDERLYLGASPRAGIALLRVAKARALADGRAYVVPDDVKAVAGPVLAHRLILAPEARAGGLTGFDLVREAFERTPVPV